MKLNKIQLCIFFSSHGSLSCKQSNSLKYLLQHNCFLHIWLNQVVENISGSRWRNIHIILYHTDITHTHKPICHVDQRVIPILCCQVSHSTFVFLAHTDIIHPNEMQTMYPLQQSSVTWCLPNGVSDNLAWPALCGSSPPPAHHHQVASANSQPPCHCRTTPQGVASGTTHHG